MSINWVMLNETKDYFIPLPKEKTLFTSPPRTAFTLLTPNSYPGRSPYKLYSSNGIAYITNQRLIYIPSSPEPHFESFTAPILNMEDAHISAPFIGPNTWSGMLKPVTGGGIPSQHAFVQLKLTFKEGGAFDFHSIYERVRDTLTQAMENAQESGRELDPSNVHLDQLPAYNAINPAAAPNQAHTPNGTLIVPTPIRPDAAARETNNVVLGRGGAASNEAPALSATPQAMPPHEPPPGYEETQSSSLMNSLEERTRAASS